MSSITPHYRSVKQLLQARSFSIDEYQREYKWDKKNVEELISDLQTKFSLEYQDGHMPRNASTYSDYFLGSIIVTRRADKYFLVDGQQRATSLTLLLIYLYRQAKSRDLSVVTTIEPLIFSDIYGQRMFNLDIPERLDVITALFNGNDFNPAGKNESVHNILERYRDIEQSELADEMGAGLETFIYWLLNNVGLIEIATETDEHAYSIFETMNDRGKPLSPVDMMKAYLLGGIDEAADRTAANLAWKKTVSDLISWGSDPDPERDAVFVKAWLRARYAESIRDRKAAAVDKDWELIGTAFHRWLRDSAKRIGIGTANENRRLISDEIPFFARAYMQILHASKYYTSGLESIFYNAHNDFTWQPTVLLAALSPLDDETTVLKKLDAVATYIDIWLMRRTVNYIRVGYSSVSYSMWRLCSDIRNMSIDDLIDTLKQKLADDDVSFDGAKSRGRLGVTDLRLNQFSRRYIFHFLARVTSFVDVQSGRPDIFDRYTDRSTRNPFDIEHIWADKYRRYSSDFSSEADFDSARDNVGGLLLLPADVNRSYQDRPFDEKSPHYAKQNLLASSLTSAAYRHQPQFSQFMEREGLKFRPYDVFGRSEQLERRELMSQLAQRVWDPQRLERYR
ncbi:DUF262 domain-containing protein [Rhodococcus sp. UNC23MFCrub1.1]|uniref:DUF262 domain-containing protein n=1 Tax=Rhodococcus sp. UNC23MFCrub1.1 TaxID=1449068 RepID=UPI0004891666|nr:DUF262 domain-containing protein [Rhodococcus sp. UNC23MFCrub1.1]